MMPDSPEARISRLEQTVAAMKQHVGDIDNRLTQLAPLVVGVAELKIGLADVKADVHDAGAEVTALRQLYEADKKSRQEQQEAALRDSASWRRALILGCFTVLSAVIGAAAVVLAGTP